MIECSFEETKHIPGGGHQHSKCINQAKILIVNDFCYGLCYHCAYEKLAKRVKELEYEQA